MYSINEMLNATLVNFSLMEELYTRYQENPQSVDPSWRKVFAKIDQDVLKNPFQHPSPTINIEEANGSSASDSALLEKKWRIRDLIHAYRQYGYLVANVNPIALKPLKESAQLNLKNLGFSEEELSQLFPTLGMLALPEAPLKVMIEELKNIYCDTIGYEFIGKCSSEFERWLQERLESHRFRNELTIDQKRIIFNHLCKSELFETFLHTKYVGQKRFSLEGGETLIPILATIIEKGSNLGIDDFVIGMAHRGRLNVLSNILNKSYEEIFSEFDEEYIPLEGGGDVKYHKGYSAKLHTSSGNPLQISIHPNPSHLESVYPVIQGQVKAKQIQKGDEKKESVIPIIIHGDAALSGQGVIYETLQMWKLQAYSTGGTVHIIINNQIGFTTIPQDGRSTQFCTDIAKAFAMPVFHVNAEDPEACVFVAKLAIELRQLFHCDVFIDLNCYRKYGHNETDEPAFTQPLEYQVIKKKKSIREIYRDRLIQEGFLEKSTIESLENEFKNSLQKALQNKNHSQGKIRATDNDFQKKEDTLDRLETAVDLQTLQKIALKAYTIPKDFKLHQKLEHLIGEHLKTVQMKTPQKKIDWGLAETLAYATLLWEGISVRLTGQDSCRGTFSHRNAIWIDQTVEKEYYPLKYLKEGQGRFDIFNSLLSEYAALGFEFGYSVAFPKALVIWEAQFGDFCNAAQIIIDQFITSGERKWGKRSGLVLLLPHGYEGQGPEHSSARIERFLSLCGDRNIIVVNPTTPAQLFHLLRRQMCYPTLKPLIVFTPKGLLRHRDCVSEIQDFTLGSFQEILDDPLLISKDLSVCIKRLVFCSGRIYYDLAAARSKSNSPDIAIIRLEQLYPMHTTKLKTIIDKYKGFTQCYWVQEEPSNMGAWEYIRCQLKEELPPSVELKYIGRARSASPAVGSPALHKKEHAEILQALFESDHP